MATDPKNTPPQPAQQIAESPDDWSDWKVIPPQPQQEPVAWMDKYGEIYKDVPEVLSTDTPLYISPPPQRTWVGLTDEQVDEVLNGFGYQAVGFIAFARAIEAKLKEKNT